MVTTSKQRQRPNSHVTMRTSSVTELHPIHRVTQPAVRPGVLAIYRLHRRGAGATAIVAWRRAQLAHGRSFPEVAP